MITSVKALNHALTITVAGQTLRAKSYEVRSDDGSKRVVLTEGNSLSEQTIIVPANTDFACLPDVLLDSAALRALPPLSPERSC